jgi:hypothetical protein
MLARNRRTTNEGSKEEMNMKFLGLLAALAISFNAHAQLTTVDNGLALEDKDGLMFANTVTGCGGGCSGTLGGPNGSGAAWVATLNAEDYGGYSNWTLATGNSTFAPNNTTNQLGQLLGVDCATFSNCLPFTSMISNIAPQVGGGVITFGSSSVAPYVPGCGEGAACGSTYYIYNLVTNPGFGKSGPGILTFDTEPFYEVTLAVRDVVAAPEINPASAASGLTLLLGGLAVLRGRRKVFDNVSA